MAKVVELPRLSDTMEEGAIAKWHVAEGDTVKRGQLIAEIETDKATMEFESFDAGVVLKILVPEGETIAIGTPIAVLGKAGEDVDAALGGRGGGKGKKKEAAEPEAEKSAGKKGAAKKDASKKDAEKGAGKKAKPEAEAEDEPEAELEEDEDADDEAADDESEDEPDEGPSDVAKGESGATKATSKLVKQAEAALATAETGATHGEASDDDDSKADRSRIAASPLARRLAREHGVDLAEVSGSGPHGRIVKSDIEAAAAKATETAKAKPGKAAPAVGGEVDARGRPFAVRPDEPVKLSQMRKAIARRMSQANAEIPHFYLTTVVDMDLAVGLRDQLKTGLDAKVSFNDLVLLAAAKALRAHPEVNAYWDGTTVVRRGNVHVGVAVAVDDGLIVPVVRFTDQKSLREIAEEARDLGLRGRDKKLQPQEMSGSTFTVSNLGMFGIDEFAAVVNPGEGAILAVGAIVDTVVAKNGQIAIGKRMKMTLACDHRVMDGATGAKFLATMRGLLEQPLAMLA
jgi:pyruvate dehydrogenase E2 component (dihydrolipoamide acetyltransferase)